MSPHCSREPYSCPGCGVWLIHRLQEFIADAASLPACESTRERRMSGFAAGLALVCSNSFLSWRYRMGSTTFGYPFLRPHPGECLHDQKNDGCDSCVDEEAGRIGACVLPGLPE